MSYAGTTASTPNVPVNISAANIWGTRSTDVVTSTNINGFGLWRYNTTDGSTELISTTYFTDGQALGMKEGDIIFGSIDTGSSVHMYAGIIGVVTTAGCGIASTNGYLSSTR